MKCKICEVSSENATTLATHIRFKHKIKSIDYYNKYIKKDKEGACLLCGSETRYKGITKGYNKFCGKCIQPRTEDEFIKAYKDGKKRYSEYISKIKKSNKNINFSSNNGNYKYPAYLVKCSHCGKEIRRMGCLPKLKNYFCNIKCKAKWQAEDEETLKELRIKSKKGFKSLNCGSRSKIADEFTIKLAKLLPNYKCYYGEKETSIKTKDRMYFYDFECREKKKIVEFNGDFFHANPKDYNPNDLVKLPRNPVKAKSIWAKDEIKLDVARSKGFEVKVVWEKDYRESPDKVINECRSFVEG